MNDFGGGNIRSGSLVSVLATASVRVAILRRILRGGSLAARVGTSVSGTIHTQARGRLRAVALFLTRGIVRCRAVDLATRRCGGWRWRALLRFEKLRALVTDVGTERDNLSTLRFARESIELCGAVIGLAVDADHGDGTSVLTVVNQRVVHDALTSVDSQRCVTLQQGVHQSSVLLPGLVLVDCLGDQFRRAVCNLDVQQRHECRRLGRDLTDVSVGLESRVENQQVDTSCCQQLVADLGGHEGQPGHPEVGILADRFLEFDTCCYRVGRRDLRADCIRPEARGNSQQ